MMREKSISFQENARESRKSIKLQKAASLRRVIAQHCCSRDLSTAGEMKWFSLPSLPEWPKDVHLGWFPHVSAISKTSILTVSYSFLHFTLRMCDAKWLVFFGMGWTSRHSRDAAGVTDTPGEWAPTSCIRDEVVWRQRHQKASLHKRDETMSATQWFPIIVLNSHMQID